MIAGIGPFDALLNIAGGFAMGVDAADPSDEQWNWMFRINVETLRNAIIAAAPVLKQQRGAIVNVGALGAVSGQAAMSAYGCAKSSVMRLTESLSEEMKAAGVNVNAVLPSIIDTPLIARACLTLTSLSGSPRSNWRRSCAFWHPTLQARCTAPCCQ
ncbi:SDR family NAD(P)-dependent oxidoreductase [Halioglobus japonicus]|uniref:SDR family NAD(P)-dependent oxidoreductase n=1 Tax=Halioglobus japonicus TaxID=930805 RepID=UPI001F0AA074|nr:SDR family NAD(P)-dependent oxidoreductase [Halioglobus japonicus]